MKERLLGALVGLARATDADEHLITPTATALILQALNGSEADWEALFVRAGEEKGKIVPNCASCASPCGRTADYDMKKLCTAQPEVRAAKLRILQALQALAANFHKQHSRLLYKGLIYIGLDDFPADCYLAVVEELESAVK